MNLEQLIKLSNYGRKEIFDDKENSFEFNRSLSFSNKLILFDSSNLDNVSVKGRGEISLSAKHSENKQVLCVKTNTDIENITPRPSTTIKFDLSHLDLSKYTHFGALVYVQSSGYESFYFHFMTGNANHYTNHAPIIIPNQWNYVVWNCEHIKRDDICIFSITPFLMGCPPEADPNISIYVDSIWCCDYPKVNVEGWNLDRNIAFCHSGYLPNMKKIAFTSVCDGNTFSVINTETNKKETFAVKRITSHLGTFHLFDFSSVNTEGIYLLEVDDKKTKPFFIGGKTYYPSIIKSLNFLRMLRCGEHVPGVHSACHLNCRSLHPDGRSVPNFGGWHDAGDVSQFEICTAEIASSIIDLSDRLTDEYKERALEEAKAGINWLLQTRFGDGYRALGVTYSIWRKNVLSPDNTSIYCKAEEGSFENFLSSISLSKAAEAYRLSDRILSEYTLKAAISDYNHAKREYQNGIYTVRWGKPIESQTMGCATLAACELYELTNNNDYLNDAYEFASVVMKCQEKSTSFAPIRGFFYEDTEHKYVLSYEHRGHEESAITGLAKLYTLCLDNNMKTQIKESLDLYSEYVTNTLVYTKPYNLLPGHIYHVDKVNLDHYTVPKDIPKEKAEQMLNEQIKEGIDLKNGWYLRIMPIAISRRGFHATLLSKTKAVSAIAKVLENSQLKQIAINQLEWVLGANPFASSTMYGEGYNYHNLYVAFSRQIVGSLPVGIKTNGNSDKPYWPDVNNSVFKEIWGHTTAKFLSILSDIL